MDTNASHYKGSEITYACLGNNQYEFTLSLYTTCGSIGYYNSPVIALKSNTCTDTTLSLSLVASSPTEISHTCPGVTTGCGGISTLDGYTKFTHQGIITLPSTCSDWVASYGVCCRNCSAVNLAHSCQEAHYIYTEVNPMLASCNSSPMYVEDEPMIHSCFRDTAYLNFGAIDPDGDSLVYSLTDALQAANTPCTYSNGYSGQNPLLGSANINPKTGILTIISSINQSVYIDVKIEEYRNGIKIGESIRDALILYNHCTTNSSPKVTTVNGNFPNQGSFKYTITAYSMLSLVIDTYDEEIFAGTQSLSINWENLPLSALTGIGGNNTTVYLNWYPTTADVGTHFLTLELEDDYCPFTGRNSFVFEIEVIAQNSPPTAVDDYYTMYSNSTLIMDVLANDFDSDNNNISFSTIVTPPSSSSVFTITNSNIQYTPMPSFVGLDSFTYLICDDGSPLFCAQGTVYITVDYSLYEVIDSFAIGLTESLCFDLSHLSTVSTVTLETDSFSNVFIDHIDLATGCITVTSHTIDTDSAIFLICDNHGNCVYNTIILSIFNPIYVKEQLDLRPFTKVFPNPTQDVLIIEADDLNIHVIAISDISGKTIFSENIQKTPINLSLQDLPNGMYLVSILTNKGWIAHKIHVLK